MGFFKKIGKKLKSVTKMVSLKNAVKVATGQSGSVLEELKGRLIKSATSPSPQSDNNGVVNNSVVDTIQDANARGINIKEILQAAAGGALSGVGGALAGTTQAGQAGATLVNSTLTEWLKTNWWKVAAAAGALFVLIRMAVRPQSVKRAYR